MKANEILKFSKDTVNTVVNDLNLPKVKIEISQKATHSVTIQKEYLYSDYEIYINKNFINTIMECETFNYIREKSILNTTKKRFLFV